ncbi:metal-dependent phosphoesterase [Gordoniibacillus kamchatkensis]|uniref:Metal-dependent phosphoesterase n=1 Tax=Gordoniibacillus kamchatkensis TaxID=1590651 RepID=A0ABR5AJD0_9BACL|nr:PHP domain-containing protein [Paenibacillus sp. VKM B-2647]KIL41147.1 metal-dependent phosphoesterase [Paenibacillus sp. VKM B-2647]
MNDSFADLHTHTTASDGTQPPADNVRLAAEAGLAAVAITDHDTVSGVAEAVAAGAKYGVQVVAGVEISTVAGGQDIHVLGYGLNIEDEMFLSRLEELRETRERRNELILAKLAELGMPLTMTEVKAETATLKRGDDTIGRPHIAAAMQRRGYVATVSEAFDRFLAKGAAAYASVPRIAPETAIAWIREAGGAPVLAHPGLYDDDELVERLAGQGLAGIEAFHADHSPDEERKYAELAGRCGLLVTAGSDFHGFRDGVPFHAPLGSKRVSAAIIQQLMERRGRDSQ